MLYLRSKLLLLSFVLLGPFFIYSPLNFGRALAEDVYNDVDYYTYRVVNVYPHDPSAFTQGLVFDDGFLYESTGLYGKSRLRKVGLEAGVIQKERKLSSELFGEGITIFKNKIFQLTWRSNKGFVYDKNTFTLLKEFSYPFEGWGITHNKRFLIISDGTEILRFIDPVTFEDVKQVKVLDKGNPVLSLNELEYIDGQIYANIWQEDKIAIINSDTGRVSGWIDLSGIFDKRDSTDKNSVLNGIAYDKSLRRLFVTGKLWPWLFEIETRKENR